MSDLDKYAKSNYRKPGPACKTCILPTEIKRELRKGRRKSYSYTVLSSWLKTKGFAIQPGNIKNHFAIHEPRPGE